MMSGIPSEKCVIRRSYRCVDIAAHTYTNLNGKDYYTATIYAFTVVYMACCQPYILWHMTVIFPSLIFLLFFSAI